MDALHFEAVFVHLVTQVLRELQVDDGLGVLTPRRRLDAGKVPLGLPVGHDEI